MLDTMIKYYTTEELLMLTKYMITPEAQSMIHKQPLMMKEIMEYGTARDAGGDRQRTAIDAESVVEESKALPPAAPAALPPAGRSPSK